MPTTITSGALTITPLDVIGYEAATEAGTIVTRLLDGDVAVTLRPDAPRSGTLTLLFDDESDAWAAHGLLRQIAVWTLTVAAPADVSMDFVRHREMSIQLDPETRLVWLLRVGYQEVL